MSDCRNITPRDAEPTPLAVRAAPRQPLGLPVGPYLCAALQEQGFESAAASHQRLDAILGHLVAPGDVQLFQQRASLTWEARGEEAGNLGLLWKEILLSRELLFL